MNRNQNNRFEMFSATHAYLLGKQTLWSGKPAFVQCMTDFGNNIGAIAGKIAKQETPITGAAVQKGDARGELEDSILEIADQLAALGAATHDMELVAQSDFTLSKLDVMPDTTLEETGGRIAELATEHIAALADYGITATEVADLNTLVTQFHNVKTAPRTAVAGRASETSTLPDLLNQATSLLRNRLDKLMTPFKKTQPEFYAGYRSARVIVDRGAPAAAPAKQPAPTS